MRSPLVNFLNAARNLDIPFSLGIFIDNIIQTFQKTIGERRACFRG